MELQIIQSKIYEIRGQKVTEEEFEILMSQFAISSWGGVRKLPFAFTEQGLAMLSGILNSDVAIEVNISIMRAFVAVRRLMANPPVNDLAKLQLEIQELKAYIEEVFADYNDINDDTRMQIELINQTIAELQAKDKDETKHRNPIGFNTYKNRYNEFTSSFYRIYPCLVGQRRIRKVICRFGTGTSCQHPAESIVPHRCQFPQFSHLPSLISRLPCAWCPEGHYLGQRLTFTFDPLFHAGCYYVQEASSMFVGQALKQYVSEEPVVMLDLCAAPGGKSTHACSLLPEGSLLVANEVIRNRSQILAENLTKWGYPGVVVTNNDPSDFSRLGAFLM